MKYTWIVLKTNSPLIERFISSLFERFLSRKYCSKIWTKIFSENDQRYFKHVTKSGSSIFIVRLRIILLRIFGLCGNFVRWCPPTQTPTQKLDIGFSMFSYQEIGPRLVSFQMIFEALQSDLFTVKNIILTLKNYRHPYLKLPRPLLKVTLTLVGSYFYPLHREMSLTMKNLNWQ